MSSLFVIRELRRIGGTTTEGDGDVITWTGEDYPPGWAEGGARAAPRAPWTISGRQRTVRTDYPGARSPSEQILGPSHEPFTLEGAFDDRYNFDGYAVEESRRVEALARRGNVCRFEHEKQVFEGVITGWEFTLGRPGLIGYSLSVSVHDRPDDPTPPSTGEATALAPAEHVDNVELAVAAVVEASGEASAHTFATAINTAVDKALGSMLEVRDRVARVLETRELFTDARPIDAFRRLATGFRELQVEALGVIDYLIEARSDIELAGSYALSTLDFEVWARSVRFRSAILLGEAQRAERETGEQADPNAIRLYQPHAGESLYLIATKVYGTPHAWHEIAERNGLTSFVMTGDELLIIPERAT